MDQATILMQVADLLKKYVSQEVYIGILIIIFALLLLNFFGQQIQSVMPVIRPIAQVVGWIVNHLSPKWITLLLSFLAGAISVIIAILIILPSKTPLEKVTQAAGLAYEGNNYVQAIRITNDILKHFEYMARARQFDLEEKNIPEPDEGPLSAIAPKEIVDINKNSPINEIAFAWFISAESLRFLGLHDISKVAYICAAGYHHSRLFNSQGKFFWNPAWSAKAYLRFGDEVSEKEFKDMEQSRFPCKCRFIELDPHGTGGKCVGTPSPI